MRPRFLSPEGVFNAPSINTEVSPLAGAVTDTLAEELGGAGHKWFRRIMGATAAVAAGVALDLQVTKHYFDEAKAADEAGIRPLDPEEDQDSNKQRLVTVPGYTNLNPFSITPPDLLRQAFGHKYNVHTLHFDPAHNNDLTAKYFKDFIGEDKRPFSIAAYSMGGKFTLDALAKLVEQGVEVPKLETLILHCSPYNYDSIRPSQRAFARFIACAERFGYSRYSGGLVLTKLPIRALNGAVVKQIVDRQTGEVSDASMLRSLMEGIRLSIIDASPRLSAKQASMWHEGINGGESIPTLRESGVIGEHTTVVYIRPEVGAEDKIVDVDLAQQQWQEAFAGTIGSFVVRHRGHRHVAPSALVDLDI